jgi:hypothetical protein
MSRHAKTVEAIYAAFGRGDIPGILVRNPLKLHRIRRR